MSGSGRWREGEIADNWKMRQKEGERKESERQGRERLKGEGGKMRISRKLGRGKEEMVKQKDRGGKGEREGEEG